MENATKAFSGSKQEREAKQIEKAVQEEKQELMAKVGQLTIVGRQEDRGRFYVLTKHRQCVRRQGKTGDGSMSWLNTDNVLYKFQRLETDDRNKFISRFKASGLSVRQISRLTGVSKGIIESM